MSCLSYVCTGFQGLVMTRVCCCFLVGETVSLLMSTCPSGADSTFLCDACRLPVLPVLSSTIYSPTRLTLLCRTRSCPPTRTATSELATTLLATVLLLCFYDNVAGLNLERRREQPQPQPSTVPPQHRPHQGRGANEQ
ncbi:unnamed protein product, partial [Ectocarpus sp. 12 AP-2014]